MICRKSIISNFSEGQLNIEYQVGFEHFKEENNNLLSMKYLSDQGQTAIKSCVNCDDGSICKQFVLNKPERYKIWIILIAVSTEPSLHMFYNNSHV